ncbi:MAG TPA: BamA/TamA family outer membrane protein, partial [Chitinophagaceae bacterium]|nr:BamA/TamA family outer membrane protein [Chitinophagaceae bacterium]
GYNPDDGFYFGGGVVFRKQAFGKAPYAAMHTLTANYAFKTGAYNFNYQGIFKEAIGKWDWHIGAQVQAPNYIRNYYGLGNETVKLEDADKQYYRTRFDQVIVSSALQRQFGKHHLLTISSDYQSVKVEENDERFVGSEIALLDSADFGRKHYVRSQVSYQFNTLDNTVYPRKGFKINTGIRFTQNLDDKDLYFANWFTEVSSFISKGSFTLASRTGVATNLGNDYEFFQANTLGGLNNLRGYRRDRYAGKTSLYQNTELRWKAGNFNAYITKGSWGLLGFYDRGRVWMPDEESKEWHYGYGGGVWLMPFNKIVLSATYGISEEDKLVIVSAGFLF